MAEPQRPLMPKATAVWLIEKTALTFTQIADFLRRELAIGDGVVADNALGHLTVRNRLHLEGVHAAEIRDLGEGQCCLFDQPHGGGFGHQRQCHDGGI